MGDEEPSEDENPVDSSGDGPKTETKQDDSAPFADKVKNLSSKSIKQIGKWNNESFLYAFDKRTKIFQHLGCVSIRYSSGIHIISCPSSSSS